MADTEFRKLIFLGDSITEGFGDGKAIGWAGRLAQTLNNPDNKNIAWSVSNLGCGGDTILDGRHRMAPALLNFPTHIILAFGTNDMSRVLWPEEDSTKLSLHYAKQIWIQVLNHIHGLKLKVAVIGTLPVIEELFPFEFFAHDELDRGYMFRNKDHVQYNHMLQAVCQRTHTPFINLYDDWANRDLKQLLCDGLHPSTAGYDLLAEQIEARLKQTDFFN